MAELDAMLRMLYGSPEADPDLLQIFAINGDGDEDALAFDEFAQVGRSLYRAVLRQGSGGFPFEPKAFLTRRDPQLSNYPI